MILGDAPHVDEPPGARVPRSKTQRERSFGKHKPRADRHVQDVGQRHEIVPRRAEAVQEHDDRAAASAFAICAAGDTNSQPAHFVVAWAALYTKGYCFGQTRYIDDVNMVVLAMDYCGTTLKMPLALDAYTKPSAPSIRLNSPPCPPL